MLSRRELVGNLVAGTAAACVVGSVGTSLASIRREVTTGVAHDPVDAPALTPRGAAAPPAIADVEPISAPPNWDLLQPLAMGSVLPFGWRVAGLTGARDGACVLTLQNGHGRSRRVHLCRNDGHPHGLVHTKQFDLVVMNGGAGDLPTEEGFAQAVAECAHVLARNESDHEDAAFLTDLMTHAQRVRAFGSADPRLR